MGKARKSTKKFEKKHLKDTIDRRKDFAKIKQRHQSKAKRQRRTQEKNEKKAEADEDSGEDEARTEDMADPNNDDFFVSDDFDILVTPGEKRKNVNTTKKETQTGKRKRLIQENEIKNTEDTGSDFRGLSDSEHEGGDLLEAEDDPKEHKDQLSALAKSDPEFYRYLQQNDADLLDFDEEQDFLDSDASDEAETEERPAKKAKISEKNSSDSDRKPAIDVTLEMVGKWKRRIVGDHSIGALRQLVLALRTAAHMNDEEESTSKYNIPDPEVYHEVLLASLKDVPPSLNYHLPVKESSAGKVRISTESTKFKTLSPVIKSHCSSVHHLLSHLSDAPTLKLTLQSLEPLLPYLLQFRKFLKVLARTVSTLWSDHAAAEPTRLIAFLFLRRLAMIGDAAIREIVLKSTYEGIVKGSRNTNAYTIAGINLMKNSAAELWGVDQRVGYTTAFTFIRQLAIHLRGHVKQPTKDSYKSVYNWQFVHSLDFWSRVLSSHCNTRVEAEDGKESQLRPLIYPVVQITLGVVRLIPTATYFPLRFQLIRSLLRISNTTGTYIPLAPVLLEVLNSAEMKKAPKPATLRPLDFAVNIRASSSYLKSRVYQDGLGEQVVELLSEFFVTWCKSIAFPELQLPVGIMLKRWLRANSSKPAGGGGRSGKNSNGGGNKNAKLNQSLVLLVQKLEANAKWIEQRRSQVQFAPNDRAEVEAFLKDAPWQETPLGAYVASQRKMREERMKIVEQGRLEEEKRSSVKPNGRANTRGRGGRGKRVDSDSSDIDEEI